MRGTVTVAIIVVVVVAAILAGAWALGLPPFSRSSSAGPPNYLNYTAARALAVQGAESAPGGSWGVSAAHGYISSAAYNVSVVTWYGLQGPNATCDSLLDTSGTFSFPAYEGSWSAGTAPAWSFLLATPATGPATKLLVVAVTEEGATLLWSVNAAHSGCAANATGAQSPEPTVSSPTAAAQAWSVAGAPFSGSHPLLSEEISVGNGSFAITYSTCGFGARVTGVDLTSPISGSTGAAGPAVSSSGNCVNLVPLPPPSSGPSTSPNVVVARAS